MILRKVFKTELEKVNTEDAGKGILTEDGIRLYAAGNVLVANQSAAARNSKQVPQCSQIEEALRFFKEAFTHR